MFDRTVVISDETPLVVGELTVYPNKLQYKNIRCNFLDIEHLAWQWSSQTTSIINTQKATLDLFIRGRSEPVSISKSTMYVTPKIVTAYNYISKETFQNRLLFYTSQLQEVGGFTFNNFHFYSDGRVVKNGNTFELASGNIEPFTIQLRQKGMFKPKATVSLKIDRDVILTLIDFILQNPQDPQLYINNHKQNKKTEKIASHFLRDIVTLMAMMSGADGHVSPEEVKIVKSFLTDMMGLEKDQLSEAIAIFNSAKSTPDSFDFYADSLFSRFRNDKDELLAILDLLFSVAIADGVLSAEEELLLLEVESIFGIEGEAYSYFKDQSNETGKSGEEYYFDVLGLSYNATQKEIKAEYRRLVMKFHPDRVEHLGEGFAKEAVIKMQEINEAYEYLKH